MDLLLDVIDRLGGVVSRRQLRASGVDADTIDVAAWYGRRVIRVRKGWYARADEHPEVLRAWRIGGRLTCVSALAYHVEGIATPVLHVEVPANSAHLRDPDRRKQRLRPDAAVVVHRARRPGPGDVRAVDAEHAEMMAAVCGVRAGVARTRQAAASASASRIV